MRQTQTARSRPQRSPRDLHQLEGKVVDGRYRVLRTNHAGPRGVIYEVEPPGVGTTRRALKVFTLPEAREFEALERLATHVEIIRTLKAPDLERYYSYGRLQDETPYLITEWLPFAPLERAILGGVRLPAGVAIPLIVRIAEAVGALHERGLCHGDIRTQHVLWSGADLTTVKLIDPGLSSAFLPPPVSEAAPYLAPERFLGQPPGPATDVYALAVLAWRLRTGRFPFESGDPRAEAAGLDPVSRLQWLHHYATPTHPSEIAPDDEWPGAVDAVLIQALSKSPGARFVHAGVFAQALAEAVHSPTPAPLALPEVHEGGLEAAHAALDGDTLDQEPSPYIFEQQPARGEASIEGIWAGSPAPVAQPETALAEGFEAPRALTPAPELPDYAPGTLERLKWPLVAAGTLAGAAAAWWL